jgi:hypothetical protein
MRHYSSCTEVDLYRTFIDRLFRRLFDMCLSKAGGVLAVTVWLCMPALVAAQDYRNFEIGAGFTPDPQTSSGTSGGPADAGMFGTDCKGSIDNVPDHQITVTSTVELKVFALSSVDTTLVVHGPAGTFCDDDSHGGPNPEINARLTPGIYEVYVGNFNADDQARYTLTLTENLGGLPGAQEQSGPRIFSLGAGFLPDPAIGWGITGGDMDAARFGAECTGKVHVEPDHILTITSTVNLHMYVDSDVDSTLVVMGPQGAWCDDDSNGNLDAAIRQRFREGVYQIYVGHLGENAGRYMLTLTEDLGDSL